MHDLSVGKTMIDLQQMKQMCDAIEIDYDNLAVNKYGQRAIEGREDSPMKLIQIHNESEESKPYIAWVVADTSRKWSAIKKKLRGFGKPSPEINCEGYFRFYRLPDSREAKIMRELLGLRKQGSGGKRKKGRYLNQN